jgi:hypothetical protein
VEEVIKEKNMRLSHILYRVENLHEAVKKYQEMGFTVIYGTKPEKAFNALIWFENGPFIELFQVGQSKALLNLMKLSGKKGLASRFDLYQTSDYGWVDYSLENTKDNLIEENRLMKEMGYNMSTMPGRRTDINGTKLKWKLSMPVDTSFPFLMSAYTPNPRPENISHKNGAKEVKKLVWGTSAWNITNIKKLTDDPRLEPVEGRGFQNIEIEGWDGGF